MKTCKCGNDLKVPYYIVGDATVCMYCFYSYCKLLKVGEGINATRVEEVEEDELKLGR